MAFHQPFDLYYWFVNVFAGNELIFLAISFMFIAAMAGMFRMPTIIVGFFFSLFIITLAVITGNLYAVILVLIAVVLAFIFARFVK